jgi:hypothetical protein
MIPCAIAPLQSSQKSGTAAGITSSGAHDAILALDFDTYVGGHVYRTGTKQDVQ